MNAINRSILSQKQAEQLIKDKLGLQFHPAGIYEWDAENEVKLPINNKVYIGTPWAKTHNIGKIQIGGSNYIVLDIDGDDSFSFSEDNSTISFNINNTTYTLPITAYTQTTKPGKYHFYYRKPDIDDSPTRLTDYITENIDVLATGIVFEWHSFSPYNEFHFDYPIVEAPLNWYKDMCAISPLRTFTGGVALTIVPSHARANILKEFIELPDNQYSFSGRGHAKHQNTFFKLVFPKESLPRTEKGLLKKAIHWEDFTLSHGLINNIATKLSTTAQLGTQEHVYPALHKIVKALTGDSYEVGTTQSRIENNILINLPEHPPITSEDDDLQTLEEALEKQSTRIKLVRTISNGDIKYIRIDSTTLKPILTEGTEDAISRKDILIGFKAAQRMHPEFLTQGDDGKMIWDDSLLPWVVVVNDIYKPRSYLDNDNNYQIVLNKYTPTRYYDEAQPSNILPHNVYTRAIEATIGKDNILWHRDTTKPNNKGKALSAIDYYHHYMAWTMFAPNPPSIKLWMAALSSAEGGAGKSLSGIEFPAKLLGSAVVQQTKENLSRGWGDNVVNARLLSMEDIEKLTNKEFNDFYGTLKRLGGRSMTRLNMKGGSYIDAKVKVAMTLSSNWRPPLPQADRWVVALEPAWLHGYTDRLTDSDIDLIGDKMESDDYDQEAQDVVNYWYHLYLNHRDKYKRALTQFAPISIFRSKWVISGVSHTAGIIPALPDPSELLSLIKEDKAPPIDLIKFLVANYNHDTGQTALPWKWFKEFIPSVIKDSYESNSYSKLTISNMLDIDFTNMGTAYEKWYKNKEWHQKAGISLSMTKDWALFGYRFKISERAIKEYKQYLNSFNLVSRDNLEIEID